ncbi:glycosyltransferase family 2 protein [Ilumatobacter nonamiensis]|uniref:glycosyltransferase family 2 protein n=1 Tax=Ilumatobacter nonamiensis TaxID=467093 RepID=UPI00034680EE|nr:glycosyltransferase family A protein [Ilumatobacter nonamiensis]
MSAPTVSTPTITAVVCTRHRTDDLRRCLRSVLWQDGVVADVLIIDDADPDRRQQTVELCDEIAGGDRRNVRIVTKDEPGLTASRNLALDLVDTDLIVFFDDDVVLHPSYMRSIVEAFWSDAALVGAGGSIDDDHDYELPVLRGLLLLPGRTTGRVYRSGWSSQSPRGSDRRVEHLIGCNMAYRMSVVRGRRFNDAFAGYALGEDLEFSHALHLDGHALRSVGDARLWHLTALPRHDKAWGYREVAIRPVVAGRRFSRLAFLISATAFLAVNARRNRERAKGNVAAIRDVLANRVTAEAQTIEKGAKT